MTTETKTNVKRIYYSSLRRLDMLVANKVLGWQWWEISQADVADAHHDWWGVCLQPPDYGSHNQYGVNTWLRLVADQEAAQNMRVLPGWLEGRCSGTFELPYFSTRIDDAWRIHSEAQGFDPQSVGLHLLHEPWHEWPWKASFESTCPTATEIMYPSLTAEVAICVAALRACGYLALEAKE